jgi:alpha-glucosidase
VVGAVSSEHELARPHHDGSPLHVPEPDPDLGDTVTVFVRAPAAAGVDRVLLRTQPDGEVEYRDAVVDRRTAHETWWRASFRLHNPEMSYRFAVTGPGGLRWLHQGGYGAHEAPDATDFRLTAHPAPPAWAAERPVYQIFPDRFARAKLDIAWPDWAEPAAWDDPPHRDHDAAMTQLYGGNLDGIRERLDHLVELGVGAIWLTPIFPAASNHRYNAATFDAVDPVLGGEEALARLVAAAHERDLRVIGDLTPNHSGDTHEWFRRAQADPTAPEARFYAFLRHPDEYVTWLGEPTLPKFDHRDPELRRRLWDGPGSVVARWLRGSGALDGWRVDVANMTGRLGDIDLNREVARGIRRTLQTVRPDAVLIGEHGYDASDALHGDGWHGVMNYAGFGRPAWGWLRSPDPLVDPDRGEELRLWPLPLPIPRLPGPVAAATMDAFRATVPWRATQHNWNQLSSHDTPRFRTIAGSRERQLVAVALLVTTPGTPVVFAGDEIGQQGWAHEDARVPFPWDRRRWDTATYDGYRALLRLRGDLPALCHGGLRWVHRGDDVLVFLREDPTERLLVALSRADHQPIHVPATLLGANAAEPIFGADPLRAVDGHLELPGDGPAARIWRLQP